LVATPGGPPGVAVVVHRGAERDLHTAGVADVKTGEPIRINDHMRIASVSKAFSGAAALSVASQIWCKSRLTQASFIDHSTRQV